MQTWFLQSTCEPKQTRYAKGYCEGAIEAYYSLMPNWCAPNDISHGEVKRYVMSKIQQAPSLLQYESLQKNLYGRQYQISILANK